MHQKPEPPEPGASETAIGLLGLGKTPVETEPPYRGKHIHTYLPTYIHTYRKYSYIPKKNKYGVPGDKREGSCAWEGTHQRSYVAQTLSYVHFWLQTGSIVPVTGDLN